jgi:tRNA(adenine34) deaminase
MTQEDIQKFMALAYKEAKEAYQEKETPIGSVLVDDKGEIIFSSHNTSLKDCDPSEHAEMNVLKEGFKKLKTKNLSNCSIFITLEPCLMCLGALINSHIKEIYFGAYDPKKGAFSHASVSTSLDGINIHYLNDQKCGELLTSFFKNIRKNG